MSEKPDECPVCGNGYDFRVPVRFENEFHCYKRYRHTAGQYVSLHEIELDPDGFYADGLA